jgi:hypothetical protein
VLEKIISICGSIPDSFTKIAPQDSSYVFANDPLYPPLNLYRFFGGSATVNSYAECYYYAELGFNRSEFNIFDILQILLGLIIIFSFIYYIYKSNKYNKAEFKKIIISFIEITKKQSKNKNNQTALFFLFLITQHFFIFDFIRTKSVRVPNFIDEYISLTSNVNFFKNLDFTAGEFIGGSYSIYLTSGPISAIGGVIGWNLTNSLSITRIANIYWIILLQTIFCLILSKVNKKSSSFLIAMSAVLIFLVPWWQGGIYLLGELSSMIIFINSIFLFNKYRNLSLVLISISIFYGKLLTLLPFIGFYFFIMVNERKIKLIIKDFLIFITPYISYLLLANYILQEFNLLLFLKNQFNLFVNHQSSGLSNFWDLSLIDTFLDSEASGWTNIEIFRVLLIPILTIIIISRNMKTIDKYIVNISRSLIASILIPYLWFWVLSPTKWIRYSQHFTVICILVLLYLVNFDLLKNKFDLVMTIIFLLSLTDYYDSTIFILITFIFVGLLQFKNNHKRYDYSKLFLVVIITIGIVIPYFEKDTFGNLNITIEECTRNLLDSECRNAYMGE